MESLNEIINHIKNSNSILIASHNSPDGDAIGSSMALEHLLLLLNKEVFVIFQSKISENYKKIVNKHRINKTILPHKKYDIAIILDCCNINRTYNDIAKYTDFIIVIDHHCNNKVDNIVNLSYVKESSSTGILIYELIKLIDINLIDEFIATCLYLTIRSDTSNFRNNNTDYISHYVASELLQYKADIKLINRITDGRDYTLLKLMGNCFNRICIDYKYNLLYLIIRKDDIENSNATYKQASSLIEYIKDINDVDTYLIFIEDKNNVKIRARSTKIDVSKLLNKFNGGGHESAAGGIIYGDNIYNITNNVINEFKRLFIE